MTEQTNEGDYFDHIEHDIATLTTKLLAVINAAPPSVEMSAKVYALVETAFMLVDPEDAASWRFVHEATKEVCMQQDRKAGYL